MELTRRQAIARGAAAAGGVAAAGVGARALLGGDSRGAELDVGSWKSIRDQFALDPDKAHLDAFVLSSPPRTVRDAIARFQRALDANTATYTDDHDDELARLTRSAAGNYLDVPAEEVALTDSTTMGLGLFYHGLRLRPGQEILSTVHDFYATQESLRLAAKRSGASYRKVRLYDDPRTATRARILSSIRRAIAPRTRVLAVTWVHSSTGVKLPIADIASIVATANRGRSREQRVLLCVDGVHGFAVEPASIPSLGCDMLSSGCHKWLYGPRGTGIVWASEEAWRAGDPTIPSFDQSVEDAWLAGHPPSRHPPGRLMTPGGYHSFEQRWALPTAFEFHQAIGKDRIAARIEALATRFKDGLDRIPRVKQRTPADPSLSAGIVCFDVRGLSPDAVVNRLARQGVLMSVTPYATEYVRAGFPLPVLEADVDRALDAVRELAR